MQHSPTYLALDDAAAMLRRIWAFMRSKFGDLGVEPVRQMATHDWLSTKFRRFEALVLRYQAGKLRKFTTTRAVVMARKVPTVPALRMPRRWGWLLATGRHHAAYHHGQIRMVLERPEIVELLETSPQAKRMVRPLCRAFGIDLPWAMDRPPAARMPRVRKPRQIFPEDVRCPLPRGVKAWVRKQRQLEQAIAGRKALVAKWAQERKR